MQTAALLISLALLGQCAGGSCGSSSGAGMGFSPMMWAPQAQYQAYAAYPMAPAPPASITGQSCACGTFCPCHPKPATRMAAEMIWGSHEGIDFWAEVQRRPDGGIYWGWTPANRARFLAAQQRLQPPARPTPAQTMLARAVK